MKRRGWVSIFLLLALIVGACSSNDPGTTSQVSDASTTTISPITTTAAPPAPTTAALTTTTTNATAQTCGSPPVPVGMLGDDRVDDCGVPQVWVPPGIFTMGTANPEEYDPPDWAAKEVDSEQPAHEVEITQGFWLDTFEVTNAAFDLFIEAGGYNDRRHWSDDGWEWRTREGDTVPVRCTGAPDEPRVCVTWYEAEAYAHWRGGRLPTQAEWEFAARGIESLVYPWGDAWNTENANVVDSNGLTPVGVYPDGVSWVGAFDLSGNAMEWVSDWLSYTYYQEEVRVDPQGPDSGRIKIEKGGWWGSNPYVARAAYHHFEDPPDYQDHHIGIRVLTPTS